MTIVVIPTDAEVIGDSVDDPAGFSLLWDRHAREIHRYVARRLGVGAADDVTAETFLTAFRLRHRYDTERTNARPWLYGIAANLIGKHHRSEVRALRALSRTGVDPVASSWSEEADERIVAGAASRRLARALASLSSADRHTLLLVAWADLSYAEIAQALDVPIGTVRSRLNRARTRVRSFLEAEPGGAGSGRLDDPKENHHG